jgi:translocator protein
MTGPGRIDATTGPGAAASEGGAGRFAAPALLVVLLGADIGVQYFQSALRRWAFDTSWYGVAERAPWHPPDAVVVVLWTATLLAMAVGTWLAWRESPREKTILVLFAIQVLLNASWPLAIFALYPAVGTASTWLGLAILLILAATVGAATVLAATVHRAAALLLVVYLAWVLYAASLTAALAVLN